MRLQRMRFTIRQMIVVVVLSAINLAAILAVLASLREKRGELVPGSPTNYSIWKRRPNGALWIGTRDMLTGKQTSSILAEPSTRDRFASVWWPLIASVFISLKVRQIAKRRRLPIEPDPPEPE
jgi:hypothetical protein